MKKTNKKLLSLLLAVLMLTGSIGVGFGGITEVISGMKASAAGDSVYYGKLPTYEKAVQNDYGVFRFGYTIQYEYDESGSGSYYYNLDDKEYVPEVTQDNFSDIVLQKYEVRYNENQNGDWYLVNGKYTKDKPDNSGSMSYTGSKYEQVYTKVGFNKNPNVLGTDEFFKKGNDYTTQFPDATSYSEYEYCTFKKESVKDEEPTYIVAEFKLSDTMTKAILTDASNVENCVVIPRQIELFEDSECTNSIGTFDIMKIGDSAFENNTNVTAVDIPVEVAAIGNRSFYGCKKLSIVQTANFLSTIGNYAFCDCSNLSFYGYVTPEEVGEGDAKHMEAVFCYGIKTVQIGDYAFFNCSLLGQPIIISNNCCVNSFHLDGVTHIGSYAFANCKSIYQIEIPSDIDEIKPHTFENCTSLKKVELPEGLKTIGSYAFYNCFNLGAARSDSDEITDYYDYYQHIIKNPYHPDSILVSSQILLPNTVETVGEFAFANCDRIYYVDLPSSIIENGIGDAAFASIDNLIRFTSQSSFYSSDESALYNADKTELIQYANGKVDESYTIPGEVEKINSYAFYDCTFFRTIKMGDKVAVIEKFAFDGCTGLVNVLYTESSNLREIGSKAFINCDNLNGILIPATVNTIAENAFASCKSLDTVYYVGNKIDDLKFQLSDNLPKFENDVTYHSINADIPIVYYYINGGTLKVGNSDVSDIMFYYQCNCHTDKNSAAKPALPEREGYYLYNSDWLPVNANIDGINQDFDVNYYALWIPTQHKDHNVKLEDYVAPTCKGDGFTGYLYCYDCNTTVDRGHTIPNYGIEHRYETVKEPTCTVDGLKRCKVCGDEQPIPSGHKWIVSKQPTCTEPGEGKCSVCGITEVLPALGHIDENKDNLCDRCGEPVNAQFDSFDFQHFRLSIDKPSTTIIPYGHTLVLHASSYYKGLNTTLPENYSYKWTVTGDGVSITPSKDGMLCYVKATGKGRATVSVQVVDESGNIPKYVNQSNVLASQDVETAASLFRRVVYFFEALFKANTIIER